MLDAACRRLRPCLVAGLAALLIAVLPAAVEADTVTVLIMPTPGSHEIPDQQLPGYAGGPLRSYSGALHGQLERALDRFVYKPGADFWALGTDTFTYTMEGEPAPVTVMLMAMRAGLSTLADFEAGFPQGAQWRVVDLSGRLTVDEKPAVSGRYGLHVAAGGGRAYVECRRLADPSGGGQQGTSTGVKIRLPRGDGSEGPDGLQSELFSAGDDPDSPLLRVIAATSGGDYVVWAESPGYGATSPVTLAAGEHSLRLDVWQSLDTVPPERHLRLFADEGRAQEAEMNPYGALRYYWFGPLAGFESAPFSFDLDDLGVYDGGLWADRTLLHATDFESAPTGWDTSHAGGVSVSSAAAIRGALGLELPVDVERQGYWSDPAPAAAAALGLRFRLRALEAMSLASASTLAFVQALTSEDPAAAQAALRVRLRFDGQALFLEALAKRDDGTSVTVAWPWSDGASHAVEVQWRAASGPHAADGLLRLWVDGVRVGERTGLDNDTLRVEAVRVGAAGALAARGVLAVDDYQTWR